jgi:DNA processing protein
VLSAAGAALDRLVAAARRQDVAAGWEALCRSGIVVALPGDPGYPRRLQADPEAPALLFALGALPPDELPAVAVIGTRSCTHYGEDVAGTMAAELARAGVVVVSGLASGIDAAALAGALAAGHARAPAAGPAPGGPLSAAPPLAIVGGGVDVVYPPANGPLWAAVARRGAVLSEAPPGARPLAWRFPQRNRLLAAASDLVVVVESHRRGGSLLTAEAAIRRQLPVGAVPGSVRSAASAGCNDLLADGAHVVRDSADVLTLLGLVTAGVVRRGGTEPPGPGGRTGSLDSLDEAVRRVLEHRPLSLDAVLSRSGASFLDTIRALEHLVTLGLARQVGAGWELAGR